MNDDVRMWLIASANDANRNGWHKEEEMCWSTYHLIEELEDRINDCKEGKHMEIRGEKRDGENR